MRKIALLAFLLVALVLPSVAAAQRFGEFVAITATTATATQTSATIMKPRGARGVHAWLEITAGSTLLLDIWMEVYSPTLDIATGISSDCPTDNAGTGTGRLHCIYSPDVNTGNYTGKALLNVPTFFRLKVEHENTNEATYVLYYQWIW